MRLFHSIFGAHHHPAAYPASLVDLAIERAVDATDARLRLLAGYRKQLRRPVMAAIDHVIALVDAIGEPVPTGIRGYADEPRLAAVFASPADMLERLGSDQALADLLSDSATAAAERLPQRPAPRFAHHSVAVPVAGTGKGLMGQGGGNDDDPGQETNHVFALLLCKRSERTVLGVDLVDDRITRDVRQVAVSFDRHRLLDPMLSETEHRRHLKRRGFDHLLTLALTRMAEVQVEEADLLRQRDLLRRKRAALQRGGWSFEAGDAGRPDPAALQTELEAITQRLSALGADNNLLRTHLRIVVEVLQDAPQQLWAEPLTLSLDAMNIQRDANDASARHVHLWELCTAAGRRETMLPLNIPVAELPAHEDLVTAARRYLY
ncbi:hypothetical protein F2Q65_08895 [Thiohalocapsa marina]|uniref:Uncharacterized protein n=1 Tax=Thiohalocapsa marina TaxID=424902 RepID=A0A5M8FKE0_9GAMM|nr:hypothetical protein [Thiohalocapsa marina]KAA6185383.1 hypothetical protein F2Q65_08895 [Thiohalocapsa marina]